MTDNQITVRVTPRAKRPRIELSGDGTIKVYVSAPPVDGQANLAVLQALAKALGVPKSSLSIASGHASRDKVIDLGPLTSAEALARLCAHEPPLFDPNEPT